LTLVNELKFALFHGVIFQLVDYTSIVTFLMFCPLIFTFYIARNLTHSRTHDRIK